MPRFSSTALLRSTVILTLTTAALPAFAHVSVSHSATGFASGFWHPLSGLDHLLAMLAVGLWAAQNKTPARWLLPVIFPLSMCLGAALAIAGLALPAVETSIAASVIVLGLLIAFAVKLPITISCALISTFAITHGYAHGLELPAGRSGIWCGAGFVLSTLIIHLAGMSAGLMVKKESMLTTLAGASIAATGMYLIGIVAV